jgi:hypothetical protein
MLLSPDAQFRVSDKAVARYQAMIDAKYGVTRL